ncbi:MAG: FAD-dependent oxidoreductase [Campylobacterota bacterium]|nr:FAD-dependent oxidoreductase [Campylobacterota bacterium]
MQKSAKIAIVGGGIAGASTALYLGMLGLDVTLFEKEDSLVSGPPMCHLHAGGNLYREIDDEQCVALLKQSIELLRFYPHGIDFRPTVLATPIDDPQTPTELIQRLQTLQSEYKKLIKLDEKNRVLGEPENYYKLYSKEDILKLQKKPDVQKPKELDEWMIIVSKNINLERLQFPLIIVQEYGLNMFRISASASLALEKIPNAKILKQTQVRDVVCNEDSFSLTYEKADTTKCEEFDYLINAAGFRTGELDDMLSLKRPRLTEFKAAYVVKWEHSDALWPEVIFHGQRGTPKGMAQFTPYPGGHFQLHGMTNDITLFENGLVASCDESSHPKLDEIFLQKINRGWHSSVIEERTASAIEHLTQYIPAFKDAKIASRPLYGAQQIPGYDKTLRASEVSFESRRYARCEIVKASSILSMVDSITQELIKLDILDGESQGNREFKMLHSLNENEITKLAREIAQKRAYPSDMAEVNCSFEKKK